jgi:hypothetical protein
MIRFSSGISFNLRLFNDIDNVHSVCIALGDKHMVPTGAEVKNQKKLHHMYVALHATMIEKIVFSKEMGHDPHAAVACMQIYHEVFIT